MDRNQFIRTLAALLPATLIGNKMNTLNQITESLEHSPKMPVLFLGHGSPMNAIEENEFVQGFRKVSSEIKTPQAILVVSAHWETQGTQVTAMEHPQTIHDFGGFPKELFDVQYPAPGSPELAKEIQHLITKIPVHLDDKWGLDHGAWSVIRQMYPKANVPVIQLSLDYDKSAQQHYDLAKELGKLRERGVLIIGSGNLVHNLRMVDWKRMNETFAYDWAQEATSKMNAYILNGDHESLINYSKQGSAFQRSIPTPEHYLPLLYALALQNKNDEVSLFNNQPVGGSLSMTSVRIG